MPVQLPLHSGFAPIKVNQFRSTAFTPETTWTVRGTRTLPKRIPRKTLQPRGLLIEGQEPAVTLRDSSKAEIPARVEANVLSSKQSVQSTQVLYITALEAGAHMGRL